MTFAPAGSGFTISGATATVTPASTGDIVFCEVATNSTTVWCTSLSGGGCSWAVLVPVFHGSLFAGSVITFIGTVTATGSATLTLTFNGSTPGVRGWGQEFSTTAGAANVALDVTANLDAVATGWAALTPAGAGELFVGWGYQPSSNSTNGTTSGYTFGSDANNNGFCYDAACGTGAQQPAFGDNDQRFGQAVLLAETSAAAVSYTPPRYGQPAAPSPALWAQRDRRDANTAGTAANPLAPPLDTAWQAGARYWHLYGDTAARDRRVYFAQRLLASDPNLLAGVSADPLQLNPEQSPSGDAWRIAVVPAFCDRREVPQQRAYYDVTLLSAALLENELLGQGDTARHQHAAAYADRREAPQQPARLADPLLIASALLENELLGGAQTWMRYVTAAWYDRREVPQQRLYVSDPLLLTTAELENELLGGADTLRHWLPAAFTDRREYPYQPKRDASTPGLLDTAELENELLGGADTGRHWLAAAYQDRREVPQQRAYVSDPSFYPVPVAPDITLSAWLTRWIAWNTPGTHADRREVPQQRPYISDPSFYPTGAATDPLTVAWGAGGPYWHLGARAADIGDRREYFTQRLYQSDPLLLLSALLENELLGGAETGKYYRTPTTHAARWWMPQQPARLADPLLISTAELENELLGGADTARHWLAACYADRREVPQQRPYISDPGFYGAVADPLAVAWGAGGGYWHLYSRAADATDRREMPQQRNYVSDPFLLAMALLENELLGGADDTARHRAWYADRREYGTQRTAVTLPDIPADPLFLGDDRARHLLAAGYWPRGWSWFQRQYFPLPLPPPAFTIGILGGTDAGMAALTAGTATGGAGGILTASDQRTGGPG